MSDQSPFIKPNPDLARTTLQNAIEDLEVSHTLYRTNHYARSIFHLQQCIEKSVKSYGYFFGLFDEKIAKNSKTIGHNTIEAYPVSIEQYQKIIQYIKKVHTSEPNLIHIIDNSPFFKNFDSNISGALEDFEKNIHSMPDSNLTNEQVVKYLKKMNEREIEAKKVYAKLKNPSFLERLTDYIYEEGLKGSIKDLKQTYRRQHFPPQYINSLVNTLFRRRARRDKISQIPFFFFNQRYSMEALLYLGIITQSHEQQTRYPNGKTGFNPLTFYNEKQILVKNYREIFKLSRAVLRRLDSLYDMEVPTGAVIFNDA